MDLEADDDCDWLIPPSTVSDPEAWDKYWQDQFEHDVIGFVDIFCNTGVLVDAMRANGLRTVLCVGSGVSMEPRALESAGFEVTALDLSPLAMEVLRINTPQPEYLADFLSGRPLAEGGSLTIVAGDLLDETTCPGPYDVIIERRTLQLFVGSDLPRAIDAVAKRMGDPSVLMSQSHDGAWRPPAQPRNKVAECLTGLCWEPWNGRTPLAGRVAWTMTTTG
ncbi:MAG: hypothetical protein AB7O52_05665 [Planctomycetota bacterium]